MASTLSSCAESIKEPVLTISGSACSAELVISTPAFSKVPSMISPSTRFLAQPREISPTRTGRFVCSLCIKNVQCKAREGDEQPSARDFSVEFPANTNQLMRYESSVYWRDGQHIYELCCAAGETRS